MSSRNLLCDHVGYNSMAICKSWGTHRVHTIPFEKHIFARFRIWR